MGLRFRTFGEISPDFMIELVAGDEPQGRPTLLAWDGKEVLMGPPFTVPAAAVFNFKPRIFYPPEVDSSILRATRLPTHAAPYESTREVLDQICAEIKKFTELTEKPARLVTYCVLASWFADFSAIPICLSIVGSGSGQRSQLFRLLTCLFRRPLLLAEATIAGLCSLPMELCPTLFLEPHEFSPQLQKVLNASKAWDTYIPRNGRLINMCCAKVIWTEESVHDAFGGVIVDIPVTTPRQPLPILDRSVEQKIADEFQPKLLMYRLKNYNGFRNSVFDIPHFPTPLREFARCLGASVPEDPELQSEIVELLEEQNRQIQADSLTSLNAVVVEAMLASCHTEKKESARVGELADAANKILEQRGEMLELKPRAVGYRLTAMGFLTARLGAGGRGLLLWDTVRKRIHKLAVEYGVLVVRGNMNGCRHCLALPQNESSDPNV